MPLHELEQFQSHLTPLHTVWNGRLRLQMHKVLAVMKIESGHSSREETQTTQVCLQLPSALQAVQHLETMVYNVLLCSDGMQLIAWDSRCAL